MRLAWGGSALLHGGTWVWLQPATFAVCLTPLFPASKNDLSKRLPLAGAGPTAQWSQEKAENEPDQARVKLKTDNNPVLPGNLASLKHPSGLNHIWRTGEPQSYNMLFFLTFAFQLNVHLNVSCHYHTDFSQTLNDNVFEVRPSWVCTSHMAMLDSAWGGWMNHVRDSCPHWL